VSHLANPLILLVLGILLSAWTVATPATWGWAAVCCVLIGVAPAGYIVWLVSRGEVTDLHLHVREQRMRPYLVAQATSLTAWLVLLFGDAPPLLTALMAAICVQNALLWAVTLRWQISAHSAAAAGLAVLALGLLGSAAAPVAIGVPLIAWARIRLRRHTLAQTIAGAALGAAVLASMLFLLWFSYPLEWAGLWAPTGEIFTSPERFRAWIQG
jgi:hypothetical protein